MVTSHCTLSVQVSVLSVYEILAHTLQILRTANANGTPARLGVLKIKTRGPIEDVYVQQSSSSGEGLLAERRTIDLKLRGSLPDQVQYERALIEPEQFGRRGVRAMPAIDWIERLSNALRAPHYAED
jgi:hypothetical protein